MRSQSSVTFATATSAGGAAVVSIGADEQPATSARASAARTRLTRTGLTKTNLTKTSLKRATRGRCTRYQADIGRDRANPTHTAHRAFFRGDARGAIVARAGHGMGRMGRMDRRRSIAGDPGGPRT